MYPRDTTYLLCVSPKDYASCHRFFKQEAKDQRASGYQPFRIQFPTIRALRDGEVVGVMASQMTPQGLVASPLHVAYWIYNHMPVVLRLIDAYETVLEQAGVTEYKALLPNRPSTTKVFCEIKGALPLQVLEARGATLYRVPVGVQPWASLKA